MLKYNRIRSHALASIACLAIAGCAATETREPQKMSGGDDTSWPASRQVSGIGHAAVLYTRSIHVEPVLRPVSFASSGMSFIAKSVSGILGRLSVSIFGQSQIKATRRHAHNDQPMNLLAFEKHLDRITGTRQSQGTIRFLVDGEQFFTRLESAIDGAQHSIDIRTYIFDNDDYAVAVAQRLMQRSRDNVRVRVMFDSLGNMSALQTDPDTLPAGYRPPVSMTRFLEQGGNIKVRSTAPQWLAGDHTKTIIIDKKFAFVGGMNIGREYRYEWHDLMMEVRGPVVDELQFESDKAWSRAGPLGDFGNLLTFLRGQRKHAGDGGYPLRILKTRNFDSAIYRAQVAAIRMSRRYIFIENAYLSDDRIRHELVKARRRGVDVRVIFPQYGNHGPMNSSNRVTINELLKHDVRVYLYPGMTHIKAAIFDGWACMGSANYDKMSLKVNKELNLATSDPATVSALLETVFQPDFAISTELTELLDVDIGDKLAEAAADELL